MPANPQRGRPRRYAEYEALLASLATIESKRPKYVKGIGLFRGARGVTAFVKIRLRHGGTFKGRAIAAGRSVEIKVGNKNSFTWEQLEALKNDYQGRADRREALEPVAAVLFEEWATDWLNRAMNRIRGKETTRIHVDIHLIPVFGQKPIDQITTQEVNRWQADLQATRKPATVKRVQGTLKAILNDARKREVINSNPCDDAEPIRGILGRMRFFEPDEIARLLRSAPQAASWMTDFIAWALHSGMRRGEMLKLRWADIRRIDDGLTIAQVVSSKTDRPRAVTCTATMLEVLERRRANAEPGEGYVFPISLMTLKRRWKKVCALAGLQDAHIHDLRRTHSTMAARAGVDLRTLADRIGHADLGMLQRHYAMLVGGAPAEAARRIEAVMPRA